MKSLWIAILRLFSERKAFHFKYGDGPDVCCWNCNKFKRDEFRKFSAHRGWCQLYDRQKFGSDFCYKYQPGESAIRNLPRLRIVKPADETPKPGATQATAKSRTE